MELLEGETLAQRMARGAFEPARRVDIAAQIADALESAHAKGIVDRDRSSDYGEGFKRTRSDWSRSVAE